MATLWGDRETSEVQNGLYFCGGEYTSPMFGICLTFRKGSAAFACCETLKSRTSCTQTTVFQCDVILGDVRLLESETPGFSLELVINKGARALKYFGKVYYKIALNSRKKVQNYSLMRKMHKHVRLTPLRLSSEFESE